VSPGATVWLTDMFLIGFGQQLSLMEQRLYQSLDTEGALVITGAIHCWFCSFQGIG